MPKLSPSRLKWAIASYLALSVSVLHAEPVSDAAITEFVADNGDGLIDADGDRSDWIEIWNASGSPGDLGGYYLTDDPLNLTKWQLPAADFNAEGFVIVFASGKDRINPAEELHASFKLSASAGSYLALVKPDGTTIASEFVDYPKQYEDVGYGSGFGVPEPVDFVKEGDSARYFVPSEELSDWADRDFDDSGWATGSTGLGYGYSGLVSPDGSLSLAMRNVNPSVFVRIPFEVTDPTGISGMTLHMKWEDGFIAYLNGVEIHRERAPENALWDSTAVSSRTPESLLDNFDAYAVGGALFTGTNILAFQGLNDTVGSSDFMLLPELTALQQDLSNPEPGYFITTTPGAPNGLRLDGLVGDTQFSTDRGTYAAPFDLVISTSTEGAEIRYTLDGAPPSPTQGNIYTDPITISDTTVVRAMAHKAGFEPTNIDTHTYVFPAEVYGASFEDALTAVPTISLVTQHASFLSDNSQNDYNEYQSSFEMIFPDGRPGVQEDGGMSNFGGRFTNFNKKSFRIAFKKEFGSTKLRYPIFDDFNYSHFPPVEEFDAIDIRSGSHDMVNRGGYMATRFADDTMLDMGNISPHGRFVHLYLNGSYWGQYHLRERWNADMAAGYFGGSKEDYDAISANNSGMEFQAGTAYDGTAAFWTETGNLLRGSDPFVNAASHIDIPNVIDFMLLWMSGECESEFRAFGSQPLGVPFKFMVRDPDGYMPGGSWGHVHPVTHNGPINAMTELRTGGNPEYNILLADRIHKHFFNDGALSAEESVERLRTRVEEMRPGFAAEARRWNYRSVASWEAYVNDWLNNRLPLRTPSMIQKFKQAGMYPDIIAPAYSQHGGSIAEGAGITMSTNATAVYYTTDGSDPRLSGGAVSPGATLAPFDGEVPTAQDFIASGQVWSYLDDASDQGTAWRASAFDDSSWESGPSELGYGSGTMGEGDEATVVNYVDIDPVAANTQRNATTYFRTSVEIPNPAAYSNFLIRLKYDDGAAIYANGSEILRTPNLAANAAFDVYSIGSTPNERTYFEFEIPSSNFVPGINVIAVEIHNSSAASSDISFDMFLRGEVDSANGENLTEPIILQQPTLLRSRAFNVATGEWSALNEAFFSIGSVPADASNLVLSELHYHPAEPSSPEEIAASTDRDDFEFAEFLNTGAAPIDLTGVQFTGGINFAFPDNTFLDPGERLVIVRDLAAFTARYGDNPDRQIVGEYTGRLSNGGETLSVSSIVTGDILTIAYLDELPWPTLSDGGGPSMVFVGTDPTAPESWGVHAINGGAPGDPDSVVTGGYLAWKNANNITNDEGDKDDDGTSNLVEYAFGTDPRDPGSNVPPTASLSGDQLAIQFQKSLSATDVQIAVEISTDLQSWSGGGVPISDEGNPDGETSTVIVHAGTPVASGADTYLRVSVTYSP